MKSVFLLSLFFFSSRRRHTRSTRDWSSDVCSSDLRLRPLATARLTTLATASLKASRDVVSGPVHFHLDASNAEPIAGRDGRLPNSFVVDVSPVRAREVDDFEGIVARRNAAVQAGNESDVEGAIGSRAAADGLDRARRQSERRFRTLQNPHGRLS